MGKNRVGGGGKQGYTQCELVEGGWDGRSE